MSGLPNRSGHRRRPTRTALTAAFAVVAAGASVVAPSAAQAATTTLYASPTGNGTSCTSAAPCSLTQARSSVEAIDTNMTGDIVVQLAGGAYRLTSPLSLGSADSGTNGHTVRWQANNIYAASVPVGADSRQLYIDGAPEVIAQAGVTANGGTGTAAVHAVGAGKCLDDNNWSTTPGTQQQIWDCNGQSNQTFTHTASGQITLFSGSSQLCLDDYGWGTTNGTQAVVYTCTGQVNQQWNLNPDGTITNAFSGLCLDVSGGGTANGTLVQLWTCDGGGNQQWNLG
ncbi:RICIN domain-containing protein [Catenulispora rubra]|uniref:RICIN domain-containing protein n=1 Tax=Catenulispora rubra TaxID=280293 RepID=UPI002B278046|nr:RICIN domain-containing protein [Catenulispora rubra]